MATDLASLAQSRAGTAGQPDSPWLRQVRRQLRADLSQPLALQELSARRHQPQPSEPAFSGPKSVCRRIVIALQLRIDAAKAAQAKVETLSSQP